jgi:probable rRNA maturation factor
MESSVNRVEITCDKGAFPVDRAWLRQAARKVLRAMGYSNAELSVYICDEEKMRALNAEWRGKDRVTDVLSFAQNEGDFAEPQSACLGDVVICSARAQEQAAGAGIHYNNEILNLLVHGTAHLAGFDHEKGRGEAKAMREFENKIKQEVEAFLAGQA